MDGITSGDLGSVQFHVIRQWRRWFALVAIPMCCLAIVYWHEAWVQHHLRWQRARIEAVFDEMIKQKPPADCPHYEHGVTTVLEAFKVKVQRPYHSVFTEQGYRWAVPPEKLSQFEVDLVALTRKEPPSCELLWKALDLVEALTPPNYSITNRRLALEDAIGPRTDIPEEQVRQKDQKSQDSEK